tara:strand:- start:493 stop:786 length:294 start_codon:yes stop_codon:yes gene_type:complete
MTDNEIDKLDAGDITLLLIERFDKNTSIVLSDDSIFDIFDNIRTMQISLYKRDEIRAKVCVERTDGKWFHGRSEGESSPGLATGRALLKMLFDSEKS